MLQIEAPARLHLGQIDLNGSLGRLYGGIGVALEGPKTVLRAEPSPRLVVEGLERERVSKIARTFLERTGITGGARLQVTEAIPSHVGLGSGTQLSLAVSLALARLHKLDLTLDDLARITGRGHQSGVGIGIFCSGGFVVDGGIPREYDRPDVEGYVPPIIFQHPFPTSWHFLLITPTNTSGYSGSREQEAFQAMPPIPPEDVGLVCRLLVMQLLPALLEENIEAFGQALSEIQWTIGKQFAPVQGGLYSHPAAECIVRFLLNSGVAGAGQSSWGPSLYGVVEGEEAAREIEKALRRYLEAENIPAQVSCLPARNQGARLSWSEEA
ncbi:MAG: beta-ribofuranosylaminobenzene 5'-phosphate synthase family protein [bacterium]|jgi:beta-ribofuranosylaminobenzene 5'-phosphate synthase|nr:GHMP kinase [Bacillota bacterium]